jgi:hypothetical protein
MTTIEAFQAVWHVYLNAPPAAQVIAIACATIVTLNVLGAIRDVIKAQWFLDWGYNPRALLYPWRVRIRRRHIRVGMRVVHPNGGHPAGCVREVWTQRGYHDQVVVQPTGFPYQPVYMVSATELAQWSRIGQVWYLITLAVHALRLYVSAKRREWFPMKRDLAPWLDNHDQKPEWLDASPLEDLGGDAYTDSRLPIDGGHADTCTPDPSAYTRPGKHSSTRKDS